MAWIESHQSLMGHPKLLKLEHLLDTPRVHLIGHLHALWWWAMDYAQDGDVTQYDAADLAIAAQWTGDAQLFVDALVNCGPGIKAGFLERSNADQLVIHDWWEYAGKLIAKRQADAERKRVARESKNTPETSVGRSDDVLRTSDGQPEGGAGTSVNVAWTAQVPTNQPNQPTEPTQQDQEDQPEDARANAPLPPPHETTPEVIETAEILVQAAWVGDELPVVIRQVVRSFELAVGFDPRDGPIEAEKYGLARAYRKKPPDDWYRAWLNWIKRARDDERQGPVPIRAAQLARQPHNPYGSIEAFDREMDELEAKKR